MTDPFPPSPPIVACPRCGEAGAPHGLIDDGEPYELAGVQMFACPRLGGWTMPCGHLVDADLYELVIGPTRPPAFQLIAP